MTEVVTVSATTAAYAAEPLKAGARISGAGPAERPAAREIQRALRPAGTPADMPTQAISPAALTLFFLTTGQRHRQPQMSRKAAEDAYQFFEAETPAEEAAAAEESTPQDATPSLADSLLPHADRTRGDSPEAAE